MIIKSLLDTDFYKFTMQQIVLHRFPGVMVEYAFKCRNKAEWTQEIVRDINKELDHLCSLSFQEHELKYLSDLQGVPLKKDYVDFLRIFRFTRKHIEAWLNPYNNDLEIRIKGSWLLTILFEVPVLAIVNEVYYKHTVTQDIFATVYPWGRHILKTKLGFLPKDETFHYSDFGTRRRFSRAWHREMFITTHQTALPKTAFVGTSNVELASFYNRESPIGTMAHEFIQVGQGVERYLRDSQRKMLEVWLEEYPNNGIALTDTLGVDAFLRDFDKTLAHAYSGLRQDSGDPIQWGEKVLAHYNRLGIDPMEKTLVFSDSLTILKAMDIHQHFKGRANTTFGIGTYLTNDFPGVVEPLNVVIKVVKCNGKPVAKISDSPRKGMCEDEAYVKHLKEVFQIT